MSTDFIAKGSPSAQQAANYIVIKGKKLGPDEEEGEFGSIPFLNAPSLC